MKIFSANRKKTTIIMKYFKLLFTYSISTLLIFLFSAFNATTEAPNLESGQPDTSIYELISMTDQLSIFQENLQQAGLEEILQEDGPVTVFLPVNSAFENLPEGLLDAYQEDDEALQELLTHHMIEDEVRSNDLPDGESVEMMSGKTVEVSTSDAGLELDNANVIQVDVNAANGIVHVVNNVIIPEE